MGPARNMIATLLCYFVLTSNLSFYQQLKKTIEF